MTIVSLKSLSLAGLAAAATGFGLYTLLWKFENNFARSAATYHATILAFFMVLYYFIPDGFRAHFTVPQLKNVKEDDAKGQRVTFGDVVYYSCITHATVGYGDIYPTTRGARALVTAHVMLAFFGMANLVLLSSSGLDIQKLMNLI